MEVNKEMPNLVGQTIADRYRVDEFLGRGGMAEVYKAWDKDRSTYLALKLLRKDLAQDVVFLRRFRREARNLAQLQHPHIVRFYGLEQDELQAFMLMDYVEGEDLKTEIFLHRGEGIPPRQSLEIIHPVCSALTYAHRCGYIHCDVKPGNIMLEDNGKVLIADFGIARLTDSATATMVGAGTPAYMAPEQVKGLDPEPQTDIYSLGVVLFEMLTGGERPFTGERAETTGTMSAKVRWEQVNLDPISPRTFTSDLSPELEKVVLTCLEKDPADRYPTPLDLLNGLQVAVGIGQPEVAEDQAARQVPEIQGEPEPAVIESETPASEAPIQLEPEPASEPSEALESDDIKPSPAQKPNLRWSWIGGALGSLLLITIGIFYFTGILNPLFPSLNQQGGIGLGKSTSTAVPASGLGKSPTAVPATGIAKNTPTPQLPLQASRIERVTGTVNSVIPGGEDIDVTNGTILPSGRGSILRTQDGKVKLILPDSSILYLDKYSELELRQVSDPRGDEKDTDLQLNYGRVLAHVSLEPEFTFTIHVPTGAWAEVVGSIMSVTYAPDDNQRFDVDCIEGHCVQGGVHAGEEIELLGGQHSFLFTSGAPNGPDQSRNELWEGLASALGNPTIIPSIKTWTPTSTPEDGDGEATLTPTPTATIAPTVVVTTEVPPTFTPTPTPTCYDLSTSASNGDINVSPGPNCGGGKYLEGTELTLTAQADSGYYFAQWGGDLSGGTNPESLTMNGNKNVTAQFNEDIPDYNLTTSVHPSGSGSVSVSPSGGTYQAGTEIELTANPSSGYVFSEWSGGATGGQNPRYITMDGDKNVTANFLECVSLSASASPSAGGDLSISPSPNCGSRYVPGTEVTISQSKNSGYVFDGWSGACTGTGSCSITMDSDKSVTANYAQCHSLSTSASPSAGGSLSASPAPNCDGKYTPDTSVTVSYSENSGYVFTGWGGACGGTGTCSLTMDSDRSVTANFSQCYSLTLTHSGSGSDPSASPSSTSGCPVGQYVSGESISLSGANPATGYEISSWNGTSNNSSTSSSNSLNMPSGDHTVSVDYEQACYTLTRSHSGSGSNPTASPTSSSGCGTGTYHYNETIDVTADPDSGFTVDSWSGTTNNSSNSTTNTVSMPAGNHTVSVNYACTPYLLTIDISGDGSVSTSPSPNCGTGYTYGTSVQLTANPANEYSYFDRWKDDLSGSTNPITITMDKDWLVTADFDEHLPTAVTNLSYNILGENGPYLDIKFTWNDAQYEEDYELWMRLKDSSHENTVYRSQNTTSFRIDDFFRCDYGTGWFVVYSRNPYDEAQKTVTVDIQNSGYYCGP
jgi:uncharacterized repeat protein (TIGR02543 family)